MAQTKHRDDQLFVAPVEFDATVIHNAAVTMSQPTGATNTSLGGAVDASAVTESAIAFDRVRNIRHVQITVTSLVVSVTAALDYGGSKLVDLPDSNILIVGAECNLSLAKDGVGIAAATDVTMGLGTATASNATLSGAMIDILTEALTADVDPALFQTHTNEQATPALTFSDDAATAAIYLNAAATLTGDGTLTATGTVDLFYIDTGNVNS